jgi:hypothetical protein
MKTDEKKVEPTGKLELLDDDDVTDLGVDLDVGISSTPGPLNQVACMTCEMVGGYESEEIAMTDGLVFNVMRMQECDHGIVYGVIDAKVQEKIATAKRLQSQFTQLAQSGDVTGAKRKWKKLNKAVENIKIRQRIAWGANRHRIDLPAIPELNDAA